MDHSCPLSRRDCQAVLVATLLAAPGCSIKVAGPETGGANQSSKDLSGKILIDGSSTVYPVTQAMSEAFGRKHPHVQIPVGRGGTGSGFKKLIAGGIDVAGASRPISEKEAASLKDQGIDFVELQVAMDGLSVVVNRENDWCIALSVKQLHELWKPDSTVKAWKDLNPEWPDSQIKLFGAGTNSGTFDYFTEVVNGKSGASRSDYSPSEDDNQLVTGVAGDKFALGYFGYSYFDENRDKLKVVKIVDGDDLTKAVEPTAAAIEDGSYKPLSRPVFIYVTKKALARREVAEFMTFYLSEESQKLVKAAHCIGLNPKALEDQQQRLQEAIDSVTK